MSLARHVGDQDELPLAEPEEVVVVTADLACRNAERRDRKPGISSGPCGAATSESHARCAALPRGAFSAACRRILDIAVIELNDTELAQLVVGLYGNLA